MDQPSTQVGETGEPDGSHDPARRPGPGVLLAGAAAIAAHVAMVAEVLRTAAGAWPLAGLMLGANGLFCLVLGLAARFGAIPILALFASAALTEAFLLRSIASDPETDWIVVVAVLGGLGVASFLFARGRGGRGRR